MGESVAYKYIRVSTRKQNPLRQHRNIDSYCKEQGIIIEHSFEDKFTGTTTNRPAFDKLKKKVVKDLKNGNQITIIFDSVSRMSRNSDEGVKQYFEWYDQGVNLIFLHEMSISTEQYTKSMREVGYTNTDADIILEGVNNFLRKLAKNQIIVAFEKADKEARDIKSRVIDGLEASDKQPGRPLNIDGRIETEKSRQAKAYIIKNSTRFKGILNDTQCMKCAGISRPTFYRYLREIEEDS